MKLLSVPVFVLLCFINADSVFGISMPVGPQSGWVDSLTCQPQSPENCVAIIDAATWVPNGYGTLYHSSDSGRHWNKVRGTPNLIVKVLSHPLSRKIFALSYMGILASNDGGKTFHAIFKHGWTGSYPTFAISSTNPRRIFFGVKNALYTTKDGGRTWKKRLLEDRYVIKDIAEDPSDYKRLYVAANIPGGHHLESTPYLLTSRNSEAWSILWKGRPYGCGFRFFATAAIPDQQLAFDCSSQIQKITPTGLVPFTNLRNLGEIIAGSSHQLLAWKGSFGIYEYGELGADRTIWKSVDGGRRWNQLRGDSIYMKKSITSIAITSNSHLLIGTAGGVYDCDANMQCRSSNGGLPRYGSSFQTVRTRNALLSQVNHYSATHTYRSEDGGKNWTDITIFSGIGDAMQIMKVHPAEPDTVVIYRQYYGSPFDRFFLSHDGGKTWVERSIRFKEIDELVFDPKDPHNFYVRSSQNSCTSSIFKSSDDGLSFVRLGNPPQNDRDCLQELIIDRFFPGVFFLSGEHYPNATVILKSTDDGKTYARIRPSDIISLHNWNSLPQMNSYFASDTNGILYRTSDGGFTWKKHSTVGSWPLDGIASVVSIDDGGMHYYAIRGGRVFESYDGGAIWNDVTPPGLINSVWSMTNPKFPPIFLATDYGVYPFAINDASDRTGSKNR